MHVLLEFFQKEALGYIFKQLGLKEEQGKVLDVHAQQQEEKSVEKPGKSKYHTERACCKNHDCSSTWPLTGLTLYFILFQMERPQDKMISHKILPQISIWCCSCVKCSTSSSMGANLLSGCRHHFSTLYNYPVFLSHTSISISCLSCLQLSFFK